MKATLALAASLLATSGLAAPVDGYRVVARLPHSTDSFTEGFFYLGGLFYEGTGLNGRSAVVAYEPRTGRVIHRVDIPPAYFGEGIVDWGHSVYEWTWRSQVGFIYDRSTFKLIRQFSYSGEGWGMTHTASQVVTSDGTATLRFRDPRTFREVRSLVVKDNGAPVAPLNELEYVKGEIYANVWMTDRIARISPVDGHVIAWIDLAGLRPTQTLGGQDEVLNGIAYDAKRDRLFVTGKQWPAIFEIRVVPRK
jgi:glutaminyl-peptide cyclotransferase